ncbi:hypothetical protein RJZ56_001861 [Blastomyces dermatitidis]|uniref:Uncharacterized protein n=1 Tax=Ajellomyces dermatitidis (strain ATCC 18188 / CBS 674.68) TaxID=653446 RepID=F2T4I9_AJEDA|nr:hypothetical protein BDDG_01354 [Blastomyces dermatitidis ATCC 18188]
MPNSTEILVHISAPGTINEDANYRAHADAYFGFEPVSRVRIYPESPSSETGTDEIVDAPHQTTPQAEGDDALHLAELEERGQSGSQNIPNILSSGKSTSLSSAWGPSFGETTCGLLDFPEISIRRSFSQSDTENVNENSFVTTSINSPEVPAISGGRSLQSAIPNSSFTETPPSEVPDSQASFQASWDVERDNSPPRHSGQVIQIGRTPLEAQRSQAKRRRISASPECIPSSIPLSSATPASSASELPNTLPSHPQSQPQPERYQALDNPVATAPSATFERLSSLPLEINPPRPVPSSTAQFTTHITPTLQMLTSKLKLSRVYNPSRQTRPLRTLERGYWLLNLTISDSITNTNGNNKYSINAPPWAPHSIATPTSKPWTSKHFFDFWDFLSKFIADDGRAGWGVWCICEPHPHPPPSCSTCSASSSLSHSVIDLTSPDHIQCSAETGTQSDRQEGRGGPGGAANAKHVTVKIYTWGEVAPHIYLLMYLASDRSVRKVPGVQWRDGAEEPVIFMD